MFDPAVAMAELAKWNSKLRRCDAEVAVAVGDIAQHEALAARTARIAELMAELEAKGLLGSGLARPP